MVITWRVPAVRARVVEAATLDPTEERPLLDALQSAVGARGLFYLATCQRILFAFSHPPSGFTSRFGSLLGNLAGGSGVAPEVFTGREALVHLVEVAGSLDALVPGEPQVFSQFKGAVRQSQKQRRLDRDLHRILRRVVRAARAVREEAELEGDKQSWVPLTRGFVQERLAGLARPDVVVVGTGAIASAAYRMVKGISVHARVHVVSRELERAQRFSSRHGGQAVTLDDFLRDPPCRPDLLVLAMRSTAPVVPATLIRRFCGEGPLLVLDLAVPRNAESMEEQVPGLRMVGLDELAQLAEREKDAPAVKRARGLVEREVDALVHREREHELAHVFRDLEGRFERVARERWNEWEHLQRGGDEDPALHKWFEQTVRALRHEAIMQLKRVHLEEDP